MGFIYGILKEALTDKKHNGEGFNNGHNMAQAFVLLQIMLLYLLIILLVGKWLFNNVLIKTFPMIRPVPDVWHLLGLIIIIDFLLPSACC
tara:strand:+ start:2817 stop:3086 length:270 start_codon:yes stop_codon:yes gene_type:complete